MSVETISLDKESIEGMKTSEVVDLHGQIHKDVGQKGIDIKKVAEIHDILAADLIMRGVEHDSPMAIPEGTIRLNRPHGFLLWRGKKSAIARPASMEVPVNVPLRVVSGGEEFGIVTLDKPAQIMSDELGWKSWFEKHRVYPGEQNKWWPGVTTFKVYDIIDFVPNRRPIPLESKGFSGAMIALFLPSEVGDSLGLQDRVGDPHVTLVYLGDARTIMGREHIRRVVEVFATEMPPVKVKFGGVGRFQTSEEDNTNAVYASLDGKDLPQFRQALVDRLSAIGVSQDGPHGFIPHVTVAYIPENDPMPELKIPPDEMVLDRVTLAWGDERTHFPLMGEGKTSAPGYKEAYDIGMTCATCQSIIGNHCAPYNFTPGLKRICDEWSPAEVENWREYEVLTMPAPFATKCMADGAKGYSRTSCMGCGSPPEYDLHWGDGRARAWFCTDCAKEWYAGANEPEGWDGIRDVVRAWRVESGEVPEVIGEGPGLTKITNGLNDGSFLTDIGTKSADDESEPIPDDLDDGCGECGPECDCKGEDQPLQNDNRSVAKRLLTRSNGGIVQQKPGRILPLRLQGLKEAVATIQDLITWHSDPSDKEGTSDRMGPTGPGDYTMIKQVDGEPWLFLWTTNAFQDRQREIFSTKCLERYVADAEKTNKRGTVNFWHMQNTDFAEIAWQGVVGRFLVEAGPFLDTPVGRKAKQFFTEYPDGHPTYAPEGWGVSPEYRYLPEERKSGVYDWIWIVRRSILPRSAAANVWTKAITEGTMALTAEQEKAARGLFGDEWVEENILTATKERTKTLEERIAFKENGAMDEEEEVENVSAEDEKADGEPPMDEEDEEEESVSAPAEKAAEDITGRLMAVASKVSDEKTKKAIGNVAGKLTPATQKSQAGTVRMLAARLDGDLKAEMIAISEELAGDGSADSGGDGGGESAVSEEEEKADGPPPSVTGEDEDEEEEAPMAEKSSDDPLDLDYEKLAGVVMEGLKSQLSPLQDGIDSVNEQLSQLGERVQLLETEEAVKMASELPRYVAEQIERASAARETALKNTDEDKELAESAPLETGQKAGTEGSAAQSYFGR